MPQGFDFFKTIMPDSRKADFYLGCLQGSVFLDFNCTNNQISLCRISFDGYGCSNLDKDIKYLDVQSSRAFVNEIINDNLDQEIITKFVLELIRMNKDKIWKDALEEYNFAKQL